MPELTGQALQAVRHRGSHVQIIASAGSGKTEVVSQRVVDLLADGVTPESIVAFTFTERAATELKRRIEARAEHRLGPAVLDQLVGLYVGTIHGYCFRLLQEHVPRYETYDVLDDNRLTAFLSREATRLQIRQFDPKNRLFASIHLFRRSVDVVENELLDIGQLPDPFRTVLSHYYDALDRYRFMTYGQQIVAAVRFLEGDGKAQDVLDGVTHLIVDEYQDVNPSQERLVELIAEAGAELCVVGDDEQAIYQWRGSDVSNIVRFTQHYREVAKYTIETNRRSRPTIIKTANTFAQSIPERIKKAMRPHRDPADWDEVVAWSAPIEVDEAKRIAHLILDMVRQGARFKDIGVLVRSRAAYPRLLEQFAEAGIPFQPDGRTGLFAQPEARVLGKTYCWLADIDWGAGYDPRTAVDEADLVNEYTGLFNLGPGAKRALRRRLQRWKEDVTEPDRTANLVGEFYDLLGLLGVEGWHLRDPLAVNRLGTLARFSNLLADYESVRRRSRPDDEHPGEQVGGQDRGSWYYRNLATHIVNYAQGAYEGFDGEDEYTLDAVDLTTIHRAKGLEWPAVFVPSLNKGRFPSRYTGAHQDCLVPRELYTAERYEGSDGDERRLFYVAMTRARDWLSLSRHDRVTKNSSAPSPYFVELSHYEVDPDTIGPPALIGMNDAFDEPISVTYSDLAAYLECGHAFRLRRLIGFQPRLAVELGYGKAVHHVLRCVADETRATDEVPTDQRIDEIVDENLFLPTANKAAHKMLKEAARRLVTTYKTDHADDFFRVWETERPFELHLDGVTVAGRADVILDNEGGTTSALAIVDYKTSTDDNPLAHDLQLQVYAAAGMREGLDVRGAYVADLKRATRTPVSIDTAAIRRAEETAVNAANGIRARAYRPRPGARCRRCEVRTVCGAAQR